ncbi:MAG: precorrin-8X methylmutase [Desulfovibrionaceae bacterium]
MRPTRNNDIHLRDVRPQDIEAMSLSIIDAEVPEPRPFQGLEWQVVRRMIHTTADFELLDLVRFSPGAMEAGVRALLAGARIVTDTQMARCGIPLRRMSPLGCTVTCLMDDPEVARLAREAETTRAMAAVDVAVETISPQIFVIGNAPTALVRLLNLVDSGAASPALVVGMPVGFVNAAESKALLERMEKIEFVTVFGRKGGSALAACVVNALANEALRRQNVVSGE